MPKVVRSNGRRLPCTADAYRREGINTGNMEVVAPRKVSFEQSHDSFQLLSEVTSSLSSSSSSTTMNPSRKSSSKSLLKRPRPCSCLAELVGANSTSFNSEDDTSILESPSSVFGFMDSPSSPWGHFVDLLVPTESDSDCDNDTFHRNRPRTQELRKFSKRSSSYEPYPKLNRNRPGRFPIITATLKADRRRCLKSERRHFKSRGFLFTALASSSKNEGSNGVENAFRKLHM